MTPGVKRLLLNVTKWIFIPLALMLFGYWYVGPLLMPKIAGSFLKSPDDAEPKATSVTKKP